MKRMNLMKEYLDNLSNFFSYLKPKLFICLRNTYDFNSLKKDCIAGLTVAIISLPLAMALAISSGTTPERGIFTAIIAGFIISFLGGSRVQIGGPTAAFIAVVCGIINKYGFDGLIIATFMAGVILAIAGLFQLGSLIKYIPHSIITGFTSGLAVVIFSTQIKDFFGLTLENPPPEFLMKWFSYYQHFSTWNISATVISVVSVVTILIVRKRYPKLPVFFIVVGLATILVVIFKINVPTIGSKFGTIPKNLPMPILPIFSFKQFVMLLPSAFTIAFLAGIESLLSAVIADSITGFKHNSNAELVAQGIANIGSACFGGLPATGAIARTVANIRAGGKTPVSGIISALLVLAFIWMFSPIIRLVPLSCLAAILVVIALDMSGIKKFCYFLLAPNGDRLVLIVTFLLTILIDLTVAVEVGLILACLVFMRRMSEVTEITFHEDQFHPEQVPGTCMYKINGPLFFGATSRIDLVFNTQSSTAKICIVDLQNVSLLDSSGAHVLTNFIEKRQLSGTKVILCGLNKQLQIILSKMDLKKLISPEIIAVNLTQAISLSKNFVTS